MKKFRFYALVLTGALSLTMLTACTSSGGESSPAPETTPPVSTAPVETPEPGGDGETPVPSEEPAPTPSEESTAPEETRPAAPTPEIPQSSPSAGPQPTPNPEPTPSPEESEPAVSDPTMLQAIWNGISALDIPSLSDVDADTLSALYGIDSADLGEYLCKIPLMNVQATEFFIARVKDGKMSSVQEAVENRQADLEAQWSSYLPAQLELVQNYQLVINGNYILFAVSEYAEEAVEIFNSYTN